MSGLVRNPEDWFSYVATHFISASVADALSEQAGGSDGMTIQQGGQTLYPAHVQYVDGNDPSIYASTNGQMYELTKHIDVQIVLL